MNNDKIIRTKNNKKITHVSILTVFSITMKFK